MVLAMMRSNEYITPEQFEQSSERTDSRDRRLR